MAKTLQFKRRTTAGILEYTGAIGELVVDVDKNTIVVQDGNTPGGHEVALSSHTHPIATALTDGLLSASDKDKLNGIASGATNYSHPTGDGNLHVPATGTTNNGKVLMAGTSDGAISWETIPSGVTDHTLLGSIGTNTHDQIDTALTRLANTSGTNTGDQTTITGNAGTATKLETARTINGIAFDGSSDITINAEDSTARIASSEKGVANGIATLDATGKVPSSQLPSFVDDVIEATDLATFPATGESGKIYIALDTNKTYRWSGSTYVEISSGGLADTATKLATARTITLSGDLSGSASFDGSENITIASTLIGFTSNVTTDIDITHNANSVIVTSSDGTDGTINSATTSLAGVMSSSDKTKLDGIATNANNYTHPLSGVTAGTYKSVTVDANGHVTGGTSPTSIAGYGITDAYTKSELYTKTELESGVTGLKATTITAGTVALTTIDGELAIAGVKLSTLINDKIATAISTIDLNA